MDLTKTVYQSNDLSFKYGLMIMNKHLHKYLKLDGEYEISYPTEVITRDMRNLRMDSLYKAGEYLYNVEAQSTPVSLKDMKRFADYRIFVEYMYNLGVNTIIIITVDPKTSLDEYNVSKTDILRPSYKYCPKKKLMKKFKNVIDKVENKKELSIDESLDIAFLPLFAPPQEAQMITEKMCELIRKDNNIKYELKRDITFILQIMIFKNFRDYEKRKELLEEINMRQFDSDLEIIAYEIYGDEIEDKKETIKQQNNQIQQQNNQIKEQCNQIQQQNNQIEEKNNQIQQQNNQIQQQNNQIEEKNQQLNETKEILKEIKEKNNLDKDTLRKINKVLTY